MPQKIATFIAVALSMLISGINGLGIIGTLLIAVVLVPIAILVSGLFRKSPDKDGAKDQGVPGPDPAVREHSIQVRPRVFELPAYAGRSVWIAVIAGAVIVVIITLSPRSDSDPLIIDAAKRGDVHQVKVSLELSPSSNWKNYRGPKGVTPLIVASERGHEEVVRTLLDAGADVNLKADDGCNALVVASERGHRAVVKLLLAARPELDAICKDGRRALKVALANGHSEIAQLLKSAGATE